MAAAAAPFCVSLIGCAFAGALVGAAGPLVHGILDGKSDWEIAKDVAAGAFGGVITGVVGRWIYNVIQAVRSVL